MSVEADQTLLDRIGISCECKGGYGKVDTDKIPFMNPDFELVIGGMLNNGLVKHREKPSSKIREVADHIESQPIKWRGPQDGPERVDQLGNGDGNVISSKLPIREAAVRIAVCIEHMQNGTCAMYELGPKQ